MPRLPKGHSGAQVAPYILSTLKDYGVEERLGYITTDNHGANDTMCTAIEEEIPNFKPEERRLRCVGHIINIAIQAFLFARNEEAVEVAIEASKAQSQGTLEEEILAASEKDTEGG